MKCTSELEHTGIMLILSNKFICLWLFLRLSSEKVAGFDALVFAGEGGGGGGRWFEKILYFFSRLDI